MSEELNEELDGEDDIIEVLNMLSAAQEADKDQRELAREDEHFYYKEDGQWEPDVLQRFAGKPRYTFDKTTPIVDAIRGEILQSEFSIKLVAGVGKSSEENADLMMGIIRNIQNISGFKDITHQAATGALVTGQAGWRVTTAYVDEDSFDQDLMIELISNFNDRVWFDPAAERQDKSDANYCFVLQSLSCEDYEAMFPDAESYASVGDDISSNVYVNKPKVIIVGEYIYKKTKKKTLVMMDNGQVYEDTEDFKAIKDELEAAGVKEARRRVKDDIVICTRFFNGQDWLGDENETVFDFIPVIPVYGEYVISENKSVWHGKIRKLKDQQRVYNYARSRQIEEIALSPRAKWMVTGEQIEGFEEEFARMNTSVSPVQRYNHVDNQPPPFQAGGALPNPALDNACAAMSQDIIETGGVFAANLGNNPNAQSGVAIRQLQNKGDTSTVKYFNNLGIAITHTARILVKAIKKIYDTERQIRILSEDNSSEIKTINQQVFDQQSQRMITVNDLTQGQYDVICSYGAAFQNRQQESVAALIEIAQVDPSVIQLGKDILLKNTNAPSMDILSERARAQMLQQGIIPESQMTDEEKQAAQQKAQQAQQNAQQDPNVMAAQALVMEANAKMKGAENQAQKVQYDAQIQMAKVGIDQEKSQFDMMMEKLDKQTQILQAFFNGQKTQAETKKIMVDTAITGSQAIQNLEQQDREIAQTDAMIDNSMQQM